MSPGTRAERLLRWYPPTWRERYGEEFGALLIAEIEEHPASWRRTADIARCGIAARLSLAGLGDGPVRDPRLALATSGALVVGFSTLALSLWTQLATAAHSVPLDSRAAHTGMVVLSASLAMLALLGLLAALPVLGAAVRSILRGEGRRLAVPMTGLVGSVAVLVAGGVHMGAHWTALAGAGPGRSPIPQGMSSLAWGETFAVNTAWAHPHLLLGMNLTRLGWMVASPIALITALCAAAALVRRVELSSRTLRFESAVADSAVLATLPMIAVAAWWVLSSQHDPVIQLRAGSLDLVLIVAMAGCIAAAHRATRNLSGVVSR